MVHIMSALDKLIRTIVCNNLRAKLRELESKLVNANDEVEKLKIEAMIEIISRIYKSECRG